ncbi:metallophosphoesterase [Algoriphagus hitonicola]|uniref:Calcineurin-like phosphoesterase n=1 Tax=Algoriphagus hitonicola TaxID=435880 RepID=A0A1I2T1Y4_9BACT|nr:metallophosphoesterase [Algoriphagus hitonicola]SFG56281.1 Calcineurin-like phosphoesterase [Algoriphagus hitonicola]
MNSLVIGDLHGRNVWEKIPDLSTFDQVVLLGDYFDAKEDITEEMQVENFLKVLDFKKSNPEKVRLLTGNHDYHYFPFSDAVFSGYSETLNAKVSKLLDQAYQDGVLDAICLINHFLISHAGVTKTWFSEKIGNPEKLQLLEIEDAIAKLWRVQPNAFGFDNRPGAWPDGDDIFQSPFSVRPGSLNRDRIPNCIHVIGHTQVQKITMIGNNLILCDALGYSREALIIRDSTVTVMEF